MLPVGCSVLRGVANLQTAEVVGYQLLDAGWDVEELQGKVDELMGDLTIVTLVTLVLLYSKCVVVLGLVSITLHRLADTFIQSDL